MSVSLNPNQNVAFKGNDDNNGSYIGSAVKGAALGGLVGVGAGYMRSKQGALPSDIKDIVDLKKRLGKAEAPAAEGAEATVAEVARLEGAEERTGKKVLKYWEKAQKATEEAKDKTTEAAAKLIEKARKYSQKAEEYATKGSKPVGKTALWGAGIGTALFVLGRLIFGGKDNSAATSVRNNEVVS